MNFSNVVKEKMQQKKITNAQLAREIGYSAQYLSDLIAGERRWNEDTINKVCSALGLKITYETNS
ncbi:helix-turn-helix domain-containing protein [Tuberibacillus sp. Marseille-P3662]|uniref:helix-turn-helix domain-containing protein n=1 Tax=Tuberibacillus sp. Marseille-P3662 TaxID=1965358 RepID=UPI000A1CD2E4|nr:helix-turn-helix transcriptional regulator [Tuberibacillus sp. Marseille-P3662]